MIIDKTNATCQEVKNIQLAIKLLNQNIGGVTFKKQLGMNSQYRIILDEKACSIGTIDFATARTPLYSGYVLDVYLKGCYIEQNTFEYNFSTLQEAIMNSDEVAQKLIKYIKNNLCII